MFHFSHNIIWNIQLLLEHTHDNVLYVTASVNTFVPLPWSCDKILESDWLMLHVLAKIYGLKSDFMYALHHIIIPPNKNGFHQ